jgi:hypothetical protein
MNVTVITAKRSSQLSMKSHIVVVVDCKAAAAAAAATAAANVVPIYLELVLQSAYVLDGRTQNLHLFVNKDFHCAIKASRKYRKHAASKISFQC